MNVIDVFVPTLNRVNYLKYTLKSILSQTHRKFNLYILDNFSNDGTEEYIKSISDDRIIYLKSSKFLTLQENWQRVNDLIKSDYFIRIDDDNIIEKDFFEKSLEIIDEYKLDAITWNHQIVYNENNTRLMFKEEDRVHLMRSNELFYFTFNNSIDTNYTLYKTKIISKIIKQGLYSSILPDRFLDYRIINLIRKGNFRYGYYLISKSKTFFTANNTSPNIKYSFYNYSKNGELIVKKNHQNFTYCVLKTLDDYINIYKDIETQGLRDKIFSKKLYNQIIHFSLLKATTTKNKNWISFIKIKIDFIRLLFFSLLKLDSKYYSKNILFFLKDIMLVFVNSFFSIFKTHKSKYIPAEIIHSKHFSLYPKHLKEFNQQLLNSKKLTKDV